MRLLLIRHGETVDNVAGNYAGVTDSALTAHGATQAYHLATHLASRFGIRAIFASDLQRASRTAAAVRDEQLRVRDERASVPLTVTHLLRERDFGILEGVNIRTADPTIRADEVAESEEAMRQRADAFLDDHFFPEWASWAAEAQPTEGGEPVCAVVAHGLFLNVLFLAFCARVQPHGMTYAAGVPSTRNSRPVLPWWSNTAYLECVLSGNAADDASSLGHLPPLTMHIERVNCNDHLSRVKRTGGGIGSAVYDEKQTKIEQFLGGRKL